MSPTQAQEVQPDIRLEQLFRENYKRLEVYAFALLEDWTLAEAAVQETFSIALRKLPQVLDSPSPEGWLRRTLKNVVRNLLRKREREQKLLSSWEELALEERWAPPPAEVQGDLLPRCAAILGPERFELVMSVVVEGASYEQEAARLGISPQACRKRVKRSLDKLRKALGSERNVF